MSWLFDPNAMQGIDTSALPAAPVAGPAVPALSMPTSPAGQLAAALASSLSLGDAPSRFPTMQSYFDYQDAIGKGDTAAARKILLDAEAQQKSEDKSKSIDNLLTSIIAGGIGMASGAPGAYGAWGPALAHGLAAGMTEYSSGEAQQRAEEKLRQASILQEAQGAEKTRTSLLQTLQAQNKPVGTKVALNPATGQYEYAQLLQNGGLRFTGALAPPQWAWAPGAAQPTMVNTRTGEVRTPGVAPKPPPPGERLLDPEGMHNFAQTLISPYDFPSDPQGRQNYLSDIEDTIGNLIRTTKGAITLGQLQTAPELKPYRDRLAQLQTNPLNVQMGDITRKSIATQAASAAAARNAPPEAAGSGFWETIGNLIRSSGITGNVATPPVAATPVPAPTLVPGARATPVPPPQLVPGGLPPPAPAPAPAPPPTASEAAAPVQMTPELRSTLQVYQNFLDTRKATTPETKASLIADHFMLDPALAKRIVEALGKM